MSETYHAVCPHCATINRLPKSKPAEHAKCGKCGGRMFEGKPVELTVRNFERTLSSNDMPVVVDFWADWCEPCKMMAPVFAEAARDMEPLVRFAKLDTEKEHVIAGRLGIRSIPTLILFKGGKEVARQAGAMPLENLKSWISQHA